MLHIFRKHSLYSTIAQALVIYMCGVFWPIHNTWFMLAYILYIIPESIRVYWEYFQKAYCAIETWRLARKERQEWTRIVPRMNDKKQWTDQFGLLLGSEEDPYWMYEQGNRCAKVVSGEIRLKAGSIIMSSVKLDKDGYVIRKK